MSDSVLNTFYIQQRIDRWQAGDCSAMDELYRKCGDRMEYLARKMIKSYPWLRGVADAEDVLQDGFVRLIHSLKSMRPTSSRDFFNLSAVHIRRELIDLSRKVKARPELTRREQTASNDGREEHVAPSSASPDELDLWCRFHEAVEVLPVEQREAFSLVFYHGWSQQEIAELFQVNVRTVRRHWKDACDALQSALGDEVIRRLGGEAEPS